MRLCIVGSGIAATVTARAALERGYEVVMVEAGPRMPMRDSRRWLDFVTTGVRPYHICEDTQGDANTRPEGVSERDHYLIKGSRLMAVGGSTLHWSGWTPRLQPEDFELHTRTGHGIDWPFGYAQLEPYYCQAESLLNVTGPNTPAPAHPTPWRSAPYKWDSPPYPLEAEPVRHALKSLGITYDHIPMSRRGPGGEGVGGPCMTFGTCRYCPMGARFDPTLLHADLEAHPGFKLLDNSPVLAVNMVGEVAQGVTYRTPDGGTATLKADAVLVAAGALETPKLLWHSGFNETRLPTLGRYLLTHPMLKVEGKLLKAPREFNGREVPMPALFSRHFDTPEQQAAGKMLFSEYPEEPDTQAWVRKENLAPDYLGSFAKESRLNLHGFIEEFPQAGNRLRFTGAPGERKVDLHYAVDAGFQARWQWMTDTLMKVMRASGCDEPGVWISGVIRRADHSVGTVRFGRGPESGVVDGQHRVFGTKNLYALTNGNFPNNGAINPTLTLTALSLRWAHQVLPGLKT